MRAKLAAPMMTLLLLVLLAGCGGNGTTAPETRALERYAALTSFSGQAQVTADYGDKVYQYDVTLTGDLASGRLEVTAPKSIAGTGFSWSDGKGSASYGDVTLETGALCPDGLSPVDGMPLILTALTTGKLTSACEETLEGEDTLRLTLANPSYPEGKSEVTVWLSQEDDALRRGEITWEGETVIVYTFTDFTFSTDLQTQEG